MTDEEMRSFGDSNMESALSSFGAWTKGAQAIAVEITDYSRKSLEETTAAWERLLGAKSLEKAIEVQSEYMRSAYQDFVAQAARLGEMYVDLARTAYKPFEGGLAKARR